MQKKNENFPLNSIEINCCAISLPIIFISTFLLLLLKVMNKPDFPDLFYTTPLGYIAVLLLDVAWIALVKVWPLKKVKTKILLTLLILTLSGAFLTSLVFARALANIW
jgi:hypothetical protein